MVTETEKCEQLVQVRSTTSAICTDWTWLVPHARTAIGQRSFAVNGWTTWNSIPTSLRSPDLPQNAFKWALNTYLFSTAW